MNEGRTCLMPMLIRSALTEPSMRTRSRSLRLTIMGVNKSSFDCLRGVADEA